MLRTVIVQDIKQLTDHYLRQQHGGSIAGFHGAHTQRGHGIGGYLQESCNILSRKVPKLLVKGHCKLQQRLVKTC